MFAVGAIAISYEIHVEGLSRISVECFSRRVEIQRGSRLVNRAVRQFAITCLIGELSFFLSAIVIFLLIKIIVPLPLPTSRFSLSARYDFPSPYSFR